jgi:hypothetical protein
VFRDKILGTSESGWVGRRRAEPGGGGALDWGGGERDRAPRPRNCHTGRYRVTSPIRNALPPMNNLPAREVGCENPIGVPLYVGVLHRVTHPYRKHVSKVCTSFSGMGWDVGCTPRWCDGVEMHTGARVGRYWKGSGSRNMVWGLGFRAWFGV